MQKLPASRKQLSGTNRPGMDRQGVQPGQPFSEPPPPPAGMSALACDAWKVLAAETVALNILTSADLAMLSLLAETSATVSELEHTIREEGFCVSTAAGGKKSHPALKALESTRNAVGRLLKEFGLSPLSRKYIEIVPVVNLEENPFRFLPRPESITDDEIRAIQAKARKPT